MLAALAANAIPSRRAMRTEWPHKVAWRQANLGLAGDDMVPGCSSAQWQSAASIDWPGQAIIVCSCEAVRTTQRSGSCTCGSDLQQIAKRGGRRARHYACALNGARGLSLPLAPMPAIQQFAQRSQKRTLNPPLAGCATSSAVGCIASPRSNPSNDCRLAPQSSRRSVDPLVSSYENPTQALQLPYVAIQGEQTQEKDEALEDRDIEFRPLRDKHKTENRSREHEAHACQKQHGVAEQSITELRQWRTEVMRNPIRALHQGD